jgi:hypothetical protein
VTLRLPFTHTVVSILPPNIYRNGSNMQISGLQGLPRK